VKELAGAGNCQGAENFYYQMILSRIRMSVGISVQGAEDYDVTIKLSRYRVRPIFWRIFTNGPAVGFSKRYPTQHPGTIPLPCASRARKLSRCKEGMAYFLPSGYKF